MQDLFYQPVGLMAEVSFAGAFDGFYQDYV